MVFNNKPCKFQYGWQRVSYMVSYFSDIALIWWQPFLTQIPEPPIGSDWYIFVKELHWLFGQADIIQVSERAICKLKMLNIHHVNCHMTTFAELSSYVEWNDSALYEAFYTSHAEQSKDHMLSIECPATLDEQKFRLFALKIDTGSIKAKSWLQLLFELQLLPNHPRHHTVTFIPMPLQHQNPANGRTCLESSILWGISPKLRKNGESLKVSALIVANYPHDTLKGAITKNLPQQLVELPSLSKPNPKPPLLRSFLMKVLLWKTNSWPLCSVINGSLYYSEHQLYSFCTYILPLRFHSISFGLLLYYPCIPSWYSWSCPSSYRLWCYF